VNIVYSCIVICAWLFLVIGAAILSRKIAPNAKELSRKIVHIGTGPVILLAWYLDVSKSLAVCFACLITFVLIINNKLLFINTFEDISRQSFGTIIYAFSITILLIWLWPNNAAAVNAGILVMAFGDGAAGLIGPRVKSPSWLVFNQRKSISGTFAMAITSFIVLLFISNIFGLTLSISKLIVLSILAVLFEQIGPWGIDNLTVPLGIAFGWLWIFNL
tara:strand:+ start:2678 stop:3331 length:654 start_codon:yes stop_codon:yes gene_type:complete